MKIPPMETELFMRGDGQTDMTKLIAAFRDFANALKNTTCFTTAGVLSHL